MATEGKTLMQIKSERRKKIKKLLSTIAGLPVLAIGISLLYFGTSETDYLYLFLYFALGLVLTLFGFLMIMSGLPTGGKKIVASKMESQDVKIEAILQKCPQCDTDIVSAGKFCGNCGQPLEGT